MKTVLIGAGFAAELHARALRSCGIEIAAVIAEHEERAAAFAERFSIPAFSADLSPALADDIDVVHLCTPPALHTEQLQMLFQHRKHVICEKPLCLTTADADSITAAAKKAGVMTAMSYTVRFREACQSMRKRLQTGEFGKVQLIHGNYLQEFHALPAPYDWRYDPSLAGNMRAVTEIGSHWLDLAQAISGESVSAVSAQLAAFTPKRRLHKGQMLPEESVDVAWQDCPSWEIVQKDISLSDSPALVSPDATSILVASEDAATVQLRFANGAIGNVVLSEVSPGRGNALSLEITCENGNLWWNQEEADRLHIAQKGHPIQTEQFAFGKDYTSTFATLFQLFYSAVQEQRLPVSPPWATLEDGAQIVRLCEAIAESAASNSAWIQVDA